MGMKVALFEGYGNRGRRALFPRGGVQGFGEALAGELVDSANGAMDETVASLRWGISKIKMKLAVQVPGKVTLLALGPVAWVGSLFTSNTEDMRNAAYSALNSYSTMVDRLDGPSRMEVLAGEEAIDKWQAGARAVSDGIEGLAKDLDEESVASTVAATVESSWDSFKQKLEELGAKLPDANRLSWAIPVTIAGLAALLIIPQLLIYLPRPRRLSGYRRSRSRRVRR